jgi:hypothetical protein
LLWLFNHKFGKFMLTLVLDSHIELWKEREDINVSQWCGV